MRRLLAPAALAAGGVAIAVVAFELVLRAVGFSAPLWYQPDARLGWSLRPGASGWYTREGRARVRVNAAGQRDRAHPLEKPPGTFRIAVLGDSYSEAMQVPRERAFWALLPARLEACLAPGTRVEALNFGVSGYGTAQELIALEARAAAYRPDLVLLQFTNGNDVQDNSRALAPEKLRPFFALGEDGGLRLDDSFAGTPRFRRRASPLLALARRAGDYSRVVQLLHEARAALLARRRGAPGKGVERGLEPVLLAAPRDPRWQRAWRLTERLIVEVRERARRRGARFVLVSVPYAIQVHPRRAAREALAAELGVPDLLYPDRRLAALAGREGFALVALAARMQPLAEARGAWFHGFPGSLGRGHWNAEGHRVAADLIAESLCAALR